MERAQLSVEWLERAMIEHNWTQEYVAELWMYQSEPSSAGKVANIDRKLDNSIDSANCLAIRFPLASRWRTPHQKRKQIHRQSPEKKDRLPWSSLHLR